MGPGRWGTISVLKGEPLDLTVTKFLREREGIADGRRRIQTHMEKPEQTGTSGQFPEHHGGRLQALRAALQPARPRLQSGTIAGCTQVEGGAGIPLGKGSVGSQRPLT